MSRQQQLLAEVAATTERRVLGLWRQHEAGQIPAGALTQYVAAAIAAGNTMATATADVAVAALAARNAARPVSLTAPIDPPRHAVDADRLARAAATATDGDSALTPQVRLSILARTEVLTTAQDVTGDAIAAQELGWVRVTDPDPCEFCRGWADGKVRPASVRMNRHHACACIQEPAQLPTRPR